MAAKKKSTHKKKTARQTAAQASARRQINAVILLAVAVLAFCFAVFPGENVWTWIHDVLLGLFSFSAYVLPALLAFVSIMLALDKDTTSLPVRVWQSAALVTLLNSTVYTYMVDSADYNFWRAITLCYNDGTQYRGSGVVGVLLGWPFERLFGDMGAKIILILLTVVFLMLVTGTTIIAVLGAMRKPVEKTKETIESAITQTAERMQANREHSADIDIDLGEGYAGKRRTRKPKATVEDDAPVIPAVVSTPVDATPTDDKLEALQRAGAALHADPEAPEASSEEEEPMMTPEEAQKELQEDLKAGDEADQEMVYRYPPLTLLDGGSAAETARIQESGNRLLE